MSISVLNTNANLSGKTLQAAENDDTVTGLKTFDRGAAAPFAVGASSTNVANLDADKVDGKHASELQNSANLTFADVTTNDVSTAKHGFAPKAPNDTDKFLRGDASWAAPLFHTLISQQAFTDSSAHVIGIVNNKIGIAVINTEDGDSAIPFFPNGGAGLFYRWTYLDPDTGWVINNNGSFSFTDGSSANTYSVTFAGANGSLTVQRTAGAKNFSVTVYGI